MDKLTISNLSLFYGQSQALHDISLAIPGRQIMAFIGPSGCGKSTLLKSLNRMNDLVPGCRITGSICLEDQDISQGPDVNLLRRRVGMVFQKPNPFPMSIYDNVAYGPRAHGIRNRKELDAIVRDALESAGLWEEVKDRLKSSALSMSGGQQQRLCIARSIAVKPRILLMDEPCSALDPIATVRVEELMHRLKDKFTIIVVTHNMQQATRVSDLTGFFMLGRLVEFDATEKIFSNPSLKETEDYITGRFS